MIGSNYFDSKQFLTHRGLGFDTFIGFVKALEISLVSIVDEMTYG